MITIPAEYLHSKDKNAFRPTCSIAAPKSVPELAGYILRIPLEYVGEDEGDILLWHGNEWNKEQQVWQFMFEREDKIPGHPAKRYRYTEEEVYIAYQQDKNPLFTTQMEKRKAALAGGAGRLVRAQYIEKRNGLSHRIRKWYVIPQKSAWAYPLDYDSLTDNGRKRVRTAGFVILEAYDMPDIAILRMNSEQVQQALSELNNLRNLEPGGVYDNLLSAEPTAIPQYVFGKVYKSIPSEVREHLDPTREATLKDELNQLALQMESLCWDAIRQYQAEHIPPVIEKLKELIGIEFPKVIVDGTEMP